MCFDLDSAPPIPPISGAAVSHDDLVLEAADGNRFAAFFATPEEPARVGVVILPDVRGLYRFYEELALRFAERGYTALAFDYFGRTAGVEKRDDDFEYMPHVQQTTPAGVQADVGACVAHLRAAGCAAVFTVGFCFGGRNSWLAAASGHDLDGAIGFYGRPGPGNDGSPGPTQRAAEMACSDPRPSGRRRSRDPRRGLARPSTTRSTAAGVEHEVVIYDGAPHSFFDRKQEEFAADSEDAWNRVLAFVGRLLLSGVRGRPKPELGRDRLHGCDDVRDVLVELEPEELRARVHLVAMDARGERRLLQLLLHGLRLQAVEPGRTHESARMHEARELVAREQHLLELRIAGHREMLGMREDGLDQLLGVALLAQDRRAVLRMLVERGVDLVVEVVQEGGRAPELLVLRRRGVRTTRPTPRRRARAAAAPRSSCSCVSVSHACSRVGRMAQYHSRRRWTPR